MLVAKPGRVILAQPFTMVHGNDDMADAFSNIAGTLVDDYITEVQATRRQRGDRPSYEEVFKMLKTLNEELTFRAVKMISRIRQQTGNYPTSLIQDYKKIIDASISRLCDEAISIA